MSAMAELAPGSTVAGCRIEAVIGRGGMGLVYRATQLSLERAVALKAIAPELADDATFRERFKRESRIAASIEHPNVIPVYDSGEAEGVLYLTMRYVDGTDLRALIRREGGLEPARAARLVAQVASGLAAAHRRGLVHRDVKPANVLVAADDGRDHAYVTDFGIARHVAATSGLTRTGAVVGTLDYLAPERMQGEGGDDASADVYALGCVLYETLTGCVPYPRDNEVAKMYAHLNAPVPVVRELAPDAPRDFDEIVRCAMAKQPSERFPSAAALADALTDATPPPRSTPPLPPSRPPSPAPTPPPAEPTTLASPPTTVAHAAAPSRRRRGPLVAIAAVLAAALAAAAVLLLAGGDEQDAGPIEQVGESIALGGEPDGLAVGPSGAWVADRLRQVLWRVDTADPEQEPKRYGVGAEPDSVALGLGGVWVTNTNWDTVSWLSLRSNRVEGSVKVGSKPEGILVAHDAVWVANSGDGTVTRILNGRPQRIEVGGANSAPIQLADAGDAVWVTLSGARARALVSLDPDTGQRTGRVPLGKRLPRGIAYAPEGKLLWVSSPPHNVVMAVDPDAEEPVVRELQLPQDPREVRYDDGTVWVTSAGQPAVTAIDARTRNKIGELEAPPSPYGLGVHSGTAWVASLKKGLLTRFRLR
jgi:sugar lactone lactonase YvrE